jgi:mannosyltransferase OCH1-like enzyme
MDLIPRIIWTIWIGHPMPDIIREYTATHDQPGFEHRWIRNDNYHHCRYVDECMAAGKYGKAADYLRMYYLEKYGGIYLDADTKVLKPLDKFLGHTIFACEEENQFVANGIVGAVPHHPLIQKYLQTVDDNYIGGGDLVFQPGMYLWTELVKYSPWSKDVTLYSPEWFLPYNHQTKQTKMTENTHTTHLYLKSWL